MPSTWISNLHTNIEKKKYKSLKIALSVDSIYWMDWVDSIYLANWLDGTHFYDTDYYYKKDIVLTINRTVLSLSGWKPPDFLECFQQLVLLLTRIGQTQKPMYSLNVSIVYF